MEGKYKAFIIIGLLFFVASLLLYFMFHDGKVEQPQNNGDPNRVAVKVYFSNKSIDPNVQDCSLVSYVTREVEISDSIVKSTSQNVKEAELVYLALNELLKGPDINDRNIGFYTSINESVKIQNIQIENKTAIIDFNDVLDQDVAGSCKVMAIRAQIEKTVLQFDIADKVIISINGESEEILQP